MPSSTASGWNDGQVRFLNDAGAYLLGEIGAGAARSVLAWSRDSRLAPGSAPDLRSTGAFSSSGKGVPPGGEIWSVPFEGGIVEDLISTRSIKQALSSTHWRGPRSGPDRRAVRPMTAQPRKCFRTSDAIWDACCASNLPHSLLRLRCLAGASRNPRIYFCRLRRASCKAWR